MSTSIAADAGLFETLNGIPNVDIREICRLQSRLAGG